MSSYNDFDSIPITGSEYWLTDRLRKEFGFRGYVVSDSAAVEYLYNKHAVATDMKDAVKDVVDDDEDDKVPSSKSEVAKLEAALAELTAKVNALAELQLASAAKTTARTAAA